MGPLAGGVAGLLFSFLFPLFTCFLHFFSSKPAAHAETSTAIFFFFFSPLFPLFYIFLFIQDCGSRRDIYSKVVGCVHILFFFFGCWVAHAYK
jgi:hypothetical protein